MMLRTPPGPGTVGTCPPALDPWVRCVTPVSIVGNLVMSRAEQCTGAVTMCTTPVTGPRAMMTSHTLRLCSMMYSPDSVLTLTR